MFFMVSGSPQLTEIPSTVIVNADRCTVADTIRIIGLLARLNKEGQFAFAALNGGFAFFNDKYWIITHFAVFLGGAVAA